MSAIDALSLGLPVFAAVLAVAGGIAALKGIDSAAAILGIAGGIVSAAGVILTGLASRVRDGRLAIAHAKGDLGIQMAEWAQRGPLDTLG